MSTRSQHCTWCNKETLHRFMHPYWVCVPCVVDSMRKEEARQQVAESSGIVYNDETFIGLEPEE